MQFLIDKSQNEGIIFVVLTNHGAKYAESFLNSESFFWFFQPDSQPFLKYLSTQIANTSKSLFFKPTPPLFSFVKGNAPQGRSTRTALTELTEPAYLFT